MNIHFLQHVPFEGPAILESWAQQNGNCAGISRLFEEHKLPDSSDLDLLVIMGGPMSVHDEKKFSWLAEEKRYIERCLRNQVKMVGICLGAQLIADVLGANVYANNQKEIGWFPIEWTPEARQHRFFEFLPRQQKVLHWHGETFDTPRDATSLAVSSACPRQAFLFDDRALGLQFHLEMTKESLFALIQNCQNELARGGRYIQPVRKMLSEDQLFNNSNELMIEIMNRFVEV